MTDNREWVDIPNYNGKYAINKHGAIISRHWGRTKPMAITYSKYKMITLYLDGKAKTHYHHRLVAEAFIPNPNNLEEVNHKDGDKHNNNVTNLEWNTPSDNNKHAYEEGLKKSLLKYNRPIIQKIIRTGEEIKHPNFNSLAAALSTEDRSQLSKTLRGLRETFKGSQYQYLDEHTTWPPINVLKLHKRHRPI